MVYNSLCHFLVYFGPKTLQVGVTVLLSCAAIDTPLVNTSELSLCNGVKDTVAVCGWNRLYIGKLPHPFLPIMQQWKWRKRSGLHETNLTTFGENHNLELQLANRPAQICYIIYTSDCIPVANITILYVFHSLFPFVPRVT